MLLYYLSFPAKGDPDEDDEDFLPTPKLAGRRDNLQALQNKLNLESSNLPSSALKSGRLSFSYAPSSNYNHKIQEIAPAKNIENFRNNWSTVQTNFPVRRKLSLISSKKISKSADSVKAPVENPFKVSTAIKNTEEKKENTIQLLPTPSIEEKPETNTKIVQNKRKTVTRKRKYPFDEEEYVPDPKRQKKQPKQQKQQEPQEPIIICLSDSEESAESNHFYLNPSNDSEEKSTFSAEALIFNGNVTTAQNQTQKVFLLPDCDKIEYYVNNQTHSLELTSKSKWLVGKISLLKY